MDRMPPRPADPGASPMLLERPRHVPRAGELTTGWRILTGIGWIGIVATLGATWNASRQLGLSTWWLGPQYDQRPPYILLLPFVAPVVMVSAVANRVRYVPFLGMLGAIATAAVGVGDLGRVRGLGVVELIAGAAGLLVSIASFSGMYRNVKERVGDDVDEPAATEVVDVDDVDEPVERGEPGESVGAPAYGAGEPAPG